MDSHRPHVALVEIDGGGGKTDQSKTQQDGDTPAQTNHLGTILAIIFAGVAIVACIVGYVMVQKAKAKTQAPPTSFANPGYEQALATVRLNPITTHAVRVSGGL
jgi:flagellar basal body-associated protein FliL